MELQNERVSHLVPPDHELKQFDWPSKPTTGASAAVIVGAKGWPHLFLLFPPRTLACPVSLPSLDPNPLDSQDRLLAPGAEYVHGRPRANMVNLRSRERDFGSRFTGAEVR